MMEQEGNEFLTSEREMKRSEVSNEIEDIDRLTTKPPRDVKPYQKDFVEERLFKARITESQKLAGGRLAISIVSIYGMIILLCFAVMGFGIAEKQRKEMLTLMITSQAILIGSAIGFYFGKNQ